MDYVAWVEKVVTAFAGLNANTSTILGVDDIADALDFDPESVDEGGIGGRWDSTWHAVVDLDAIGLLDHRDRLDVRFTSATRQIRDGAAIPTVYPDLIAPYLDAEQAAFLEAALVLAETQHDDYASIVDVDARDVLTHLGWDPATVDYYGISAALADLGFCPPDAFHGRPCRPPTDLPWRRQGDAPSRDGVARAPGDPRGGVGDRISRPQARAASGYGVAQR